MKNLDIKAASGVSFFFALLADIEGQKERRRRAPSGYENKE
jgi:hypothetical protein